MPNWQSSFHLLRFTHGDYQTKISGSHTNHGQSWTLLVSLLFSSVIFRETRNAQIGQHTYHHICFMCHQLPQGVSENIDRARKQCLWRGNTAQQKGANLVAWPIVLQPKDKGGLGVLNLRMQNNALLLKNLDKFYNKKDIPWVQLIWWKYYQDSPTCHQGDTLILVERHSETQQSLSSCSTLYSYRWLHNPFLGWPLGWSGPL